jgi:hypothetical protein
VKALRRARARIGHDLQHARRRYPAHLGVGRLAGRIAAQLADGLGDEVEVPRFVGEELLQLVDRRSAWNFSEGFEATEDRLIQPRAPALERTALAELVEQHRRLDAREPLDGKCHRASYARWS